MSTGQERNNRSQGQRIRRNRENLDAIVEVQERTTDVVAQHDRDIKLIKSRLSALEREQVRKE